MFLKDLLEYFNIDEKFPDYLLDESFNEIFLEGDFSKKDNYYKIVVKTRQNVIHRMYLCPDDDFPLTVISQLPNGLLNGIKFGINPDEVKYISEL